MGRSAEIGSFLPELRHPCEFKACGDTSPGPVSSLDRLDVLECKHIRDVSERVDVVEKNADKYMDRVHSLEDLFDIEAYCHTIGC